MERHVVPAISPWAASVGYSRAVRVGNHVFVGGTAAVMPDGSEPPADAYGQAKHCLGIIVRALAELGASAEDVVRTRVYISSLEHGDGAGRAHGEVFGEIRPASAMIVVSGFLDPRFLVEIEAEALIR